MGQCGYALQVRRFWTGMRVMKCLLDCSEVHASECSVRMSCMSSLSNLFKTRLLVGLAVAWSSCLLAQEVFVATGGDDSADGARERPFASVVRARDAIRAARRQAPKDASTPATIWFLPGVYRLTDTLELNQEDVGLTLSAVRSGETVIDAGVPLRVEQFQLSDDARLPGEAMGKVWQLDLAAVGVKHLGPFPVRFADGGGVVQLFADRAWQPLSRWPNDGHAKMKKVLDRGDDPGAPGKRPGSFEFAGDRPARWKAAADTGQLWLAGFWRVAWDWQSVRVQTLDLEARSVGLAAPIGGGIGSKYAGPEGAGTEPWCAINLLEEIDAPGEWAIDFTKSALFWWPPVDWKTAAAQAPEIRLADLDGPMIRLKETRSVTIAGLILQGGLGNGIEVSGGQGNQVLGCQLRCLGKNGVVIKGGKCHRVQSCDLKTLGHGGILIGGGDRATLTPCGHVADNNHIHHYALGKKIWSPGIGVGARDSGYACGAVITHNLVHDSPHAAILYGGNDHRFEFNEVHDFLVESDDLGGFYTNDGWASYGNVLRHNFIHHTAHALGVYLDDADSGDVVESNLMFRMGTGAAIGGGHDNVLRGNVAIDCPGGFGIDARGVGRKYAEDSGMLRDYRALNPVLPPWSERFPTLPKLLENSPELPLGCILERNVVVGTAKSAELRGKPEHFAVVTVRDNVALPLEDLGFEDPAALNFRMAPNAKVLQTVPGFVPVPFAEIGLYLDAHRPTLPEHRSGHTRSQWHRRDEPASGSGK